MRKLAFALAIPALIAAVPASAEVIGGVHVAVNRHEYRGTGCPIEVVFTASVQHHAGPRSRGRLQLPLGAQRRRQDRHPGGQGGRRTAARMVFKDKWRLGKPGSIHDVSATFHVNSGNQHIQETSETVHIECR